MSVRPLKALVRGVAAAAAVGALVLGGAATAAFAAPTIPVDPTQKGQITVHKFKTPAGGPGAESTGKELDSDAIKDLVPLGGVEFTLERLTNFDLRTNAGWESLKDLTVQKAIDTEPKDAATTVTTDGTGIAVASDLPLGVYLVTETGYPADVVPAKPFLVTVPMTDPDAQNTWMYDIHVYPKNQVLGAEKTVEDKPSLAIGDPVVWTILGDIPGVDVIDGYKIVDPLDGRLTYDPANKATLSLTNAAGFPLVEGTDYTLEAVEVDSKWTVTALFTEAGRIKLAQAKKADAAAQVQLVIPTTVNSVGTGEILNTALVYPNEPSFGILPGQPGGPLEPEEITKWGNIDILKVDDKNKLLAGAEFQVFLSKADALALNKPISLNGKRPSRPMRMASSGSPACVRRTGRTAPPWQLAKKAGSRTGWLRPSPRKASSFSPSRPRFWLSSPRTRSSRRSSTPRTTVASNSRSRVPKSARWSSTVPARRSFSDSLSC